LPFRAEALGNRAHLYAACLEVVANARLIGWFHPKGEMIEVACILSGCCATGSAMFAIDGNEINDRSARAQLDQADVVLAPVHRTSESVAVEAHHALEVDDAQHKMVDFANADQMSLQAPGVPVALAAELHGHIRHFIVHDPSNRVLGIT
jgi:hypothetical protein